jgi:hypothetical protein
MPHTSRRSNGSSASPKREAVFSKRNSNNDLNPWDNPLAIAPVAAKLMVRDP